MKLHEVLSVTGEKLPLNYWEQIAKEKIEAEDETGIRHMVLRDDKTAVMQNDCGFTCRDCGKFTPGQETGKHDCLLSVAVLVLPTGETLWMESEQYKPGYMRKVIQAWKDQHPEFDGSKCSMGAIEIIMPLSQYKAIQTSNTFDWPDA